MPGTSFKRVAPFHGGFFVSSASISRWQYLMVVIFERLRFAFYAVECNLTKLTTKSACVPVVESGVFLFVHAPVFHVLLD